MKPVFRYISAYFRETNRNVLLAVSVWTALLILANYDLGVDDHISYQSSFPKRLTGKYLLFLPAFLVPYLLYNYLGGKSYLSTRPFLILALLAPLLFAFKASLRFQFSISHDPYVDYYANQVLYWPFLLLIMLICLYIIWKWNDADQPFYGTKYRNVQWSPYWIMLLIMIPLIALASTQPDFLQTYPKLKSILQLTNNYEFSFLQKLLFELSYGSDFIGIEIFFRGFLILAFMKWAGKDAILPMACFYCTIHFGKPLGECISSYFGGMILGIVVSNTKSIWGGLMVHLGIAWMMGWPDGSPRYCVDDGAGWIFGQFKNLKIFLIQGRCYLLNLSKPCVKMYKQFQFDTFSN